MNSEGGVALDLAQAGWRKPRRSQANGNCVEVADGFPGIVPVRDSKNPDAALVLPMETWNAFVAHLKD
ncbi:DUF397 domain-containing protein [Streptomyces millisiae]|uniref:DUF397 domain-containing protein n=1 Tax=Streptomyces millisiae TaxID=3075542 RepID=A0ABU2LZ81_9ACTN|nr:DUF397 domain-containing protein [Streptomyces sp. DSM 44918]MDT0322876.1 DUF397 domain-containing protein [Streptomyces sp. DSM 44918]